MIKNTGEVKSISFEIYELMYSEYRDSFYDENYGYALEILEKVLLCPDIVVDGIKPGGTVSMEIDYAFCLAKCGRFEEALLWVEKLHKELEGEMYSKHISEGFSIEFKKSLWKKICIICAVSLAPEKVSECLTKMEKYGIDIDVSLYKKIAKYFKLAGRLDWAIFFYCQALTQASKCEMQDEVEKISNEIRKINDLSNRSGSSVDNLFIGYEYFVAEGRWLRPGMVVKCKVTNFDRNKNPLVPSMEAFDFPKFMPFLIWGVSEKYIYAFPLRKFDESRAGKQIKFEVPVGSGNYKLLKDHLYMIPKLSGVIEEVQCKIPNNIFRNVIEAFYIDIANCRKKDDVNGDDYLLGLFMRKLTLERIGKVGDRLIIGSEYYYIVSVDFIRSEYIVVPVKYKGFVKEKQSYRIPFENDAIFAIIPTSEDRKRNAELGISNLDLNCAYRFVKHKCMPYLITGEDGDCYVCRSIVDESEGKKSEVCYFPKSSVDLLRCCNGEDIIKYFNNIYSGRVHVKKHVAGN